MSKPGIYLGHNKHRLVLYFLQEYQSLKKKQSMAQKDLQAHHDDSLDDKKYKAMLDLPSSDRT